MNGWFTAIQSRITVRLRLTRRGGVEVQERMVASIDFVAAPFGIENPKTDEKNGKRGESKP